MSDPSPTNDHRSRPWRLRAAGVAVAGVTLALMLATEPRLAIGWDEGYTLGREARIRLWLRALRDPAAFARTWEPPRLELVQTENGGTPPRRDQVDTRAKLFDPAVLTWFWPFAREEPHGHPPFYALVGLVGDLVVPGWPTLPRARFGPILLFSLTAGLLFTFSASRWGLWAGAASAGAWVLQPQLFGHGHYAAYDALLTCLWVDAIVVFWLAVEPGDGKLPRSRPRWGWAVALGVLFGWASDTKLTGWFLPLPFLCWAFVYRSKAALKAALVVAPIALVSLYLFNPAWWANPVGGIERFLRSNLNRQQSINIPIRFLGTIYNTPVESLPAYNTLAWTLMATPVGFLALAIIGGVRAVRRPKADPFGVLVLVHWAFLIALRALPHTPGHDGIRLFLPAFGVLAILAGLGAAWLSGRRWGRVVVAAALIEGAASVAVMMPVPLSYYSPIVGGLPGATRLGMEPTYYWDALSDDALEFLNTHTSPDRTVAFATFPTSFLDLKQSGRLKAGLAPIDRAPPAWYVVQNRPGALQPRDRAFIDRVPPAYTVSKLGVPLIWIFPINSAVPR
jgi:Dolichyl-phosphate-mannose-protein mannosyltransferase